ncbi:MAG: hypothetical protein V7776_16955 [Halopseudomonas aestusnigri]
MAHQDNDVEGPVTTREQTILLFVVEGKSNKHVAAELISRYEPWRPTARISNESWISAQPQALHAMPLKTGCYPAKSDVVAKIIVSVL